MKTYTHLTHVTSEDALSAICKEGLRAGSYWSVLAPLTDYYAQTVKDGGRVPVVMRVAADRLLPEHRQPDKPGLEEPITTVLRACADACTEEEIWALWEGSSKTAQDSIDIVGSLRYAVSVPAEHLEVRAPDGSWVPLLTPSRPSSQTRRPPRPR